MMVQTGMAKAMAEAPNIFPLLILTFLLHPFISIPAFLESCVIMTFLKWIRDKHKTYSIMASKADTSTRKMRRHKQSITKHLQYHCFKQ